MTREELQQRFPNASEQFLRANTGYTVAAATPHAEAPDPVVERDLRPRSLAARKAKGINPGRFLIRVTSFRRRLLDEDNLCEKYVVDCCRYAQLLPGDAPGTTRIETRQEKVRSKEHERTEIEIERLT